MLSLGWQEMAVIFILALVLFGPRKLPELGKTIGKAITEFRRASNELKSTFDREMQTIERENESIKDTAQKYMDEVTGGSNGYDSSYDSSYYDSEAYGNYEYGSTDNSGSNGSSTASNSTSVSEPATQGAESTPDAVVETAEATTISPAEGTVARGSNAVAAAAEGPVTDTAAPEGVKS